MAPRITLPILVAVSFVCTALTITNAMVMKKQFYPSIVYMTKNNFSMAVIYVQGLVLTYLAFTVLRAIFFGQLRAAEVEHAQDRVWHAIMETCLAFAVFRDDFSTKFAIQFVVLFFVKGFHWLAEDRVDYMERSPLITLTFHARILGISTLLSAINSYFISSAYFFTMNKGASAQVVFGFEYAVLMTMIMHIIIKYLLHTHDLQQNHPWENKAVYMLYAELFINLLKCVLYLFFFLVMMKIHTFPLFAIRQFYLTVRSFQKALNDVIQSRRAIHAMNNLFPLASADELTQGDATCIICREEMTVESGAKKLPCNHIFHPNCLRSWFQRQQTCPTCRTDILAQRRPQNVIPGQQNNNNQANGNAQQPQPVQQQQPMFQHPMMRQLFGQMGQQNQPQAAPVNQPPQMFPFLAHNFGFQPPQMNFQQQQPPQAPGAQEQQPGQGQPQPQQMPGGLPFPSFPGFPMPPLLTPSPFPFPQPPVFSGLSDEEIAEMEGTQRAAVEARLQALNNVTVLLDAAVLQFQQYLSVVNTLPATARTTPPAAGPTANSNAPTDTAANATENPSTAAGQEGIPAASSSLNNGSSINGHVNLDATVPENIPSSSSFLPRSAENHLPEPAAETAEVVPEAAEDSASNMSPEDAEGLEEIRRRRARYFGVNNG